MQLICSNSFAHFEMKVVCICLCANDLLKYCYLPCRSIHYMYNDDKFLGAILFFVIVFVFICSAKRRLSQLGSLLKLNQHCIDTALGFFKMALQLNLTRGRKSSIMDTACLYLVCRSEGTPRIFLSLGLL